MKFDGASIENSELVDVNLRGIDFSGTTFKNTTINGVKHETPESGEEHGGITMIRDSQS